MWLHLGLLASSQPACDTSVAQREAQVNVTLSSLRRLGYSISDGEFRVANSSRFGANPGNPYVVYWFPLPFFRLEDARDAFLFVGCTPPRAKYFGYRSYLFNDGELSVPFASLGDTLNNLVINTTGAGAGDVYSRTTAVLTVGDDITRADASAALVSAGLGGATNVDAFAPSAILSVREATLAFLHRASVWEHAEDKAPYFAQTRRVYRIRPPAGREAKPMALVPDRHRGTGVSEASLVPDFDASMATLRAGIVAAMAATGRNLTSERASVNYPLYGLDCIEDHTKCLGDNHDANYIKSEPVRLAAPDRFVLYGANCVANGKCTYTNIGIYLVDQHTLRNFTVTSTPLSVSDVKFAGSAAHYAPALPAAAAERLFAYAIARDCAGAPYCLSVGDDVVPAWREWLSVYRTYLEPSTKTGPLASELVMPRLLHFEGA